MKMVNLKCNNCGVLFDRYIGEHRRQLKNGKTEFYCGYKCAMIKLGEKRRFPLVKKICEMCKNQFFDKPFKSGRRCCSIACSRKLAGKIQVDKWKGYVPPPKKENKAPKNWIKGQSFDPEQEIARRKKISERMKLVGGGYRRGSGRGKKGWYKGYWCDSSWELAWIIYQLERGISFRRNEDKFEYTVDSVTHNYIPDFYVDGGYVEIKGYDCDKWQNKKEQFPRKLTVLYEKDMTPILEYVRSKYGKNFVQLYEESKTAGVQSSL